MTSQSKIYMGIDIGSVSLNIAIIDEELNLLKSIYRRTSGQPIPMLIEVFEALKSEFPQLTGVVSTGSGRNLVADILDFLAGGHRLYRLGHVAGQPDEFLLQFVVSLLSSAEHIPTSCPDNA